MKIDITPLAREQVTAAIADEDRQDLKLRVAIVGRGPGGFRYSLDLVAPGEHPETDLEVAVGELDVLVDRDSAADLEGVSIDFVTRLQESGFKFDNPNSIWSDPKAAAVQDVIDRKINPAIASHGGFISLIDVQDDVAYIELGGGCQGCGMADVTLKQGVERTILEQVPEIAAV
ncbi:MAG: iron-sulfur cluster assembly accessory protein, partial [Thermoanaerobaculia bacterium]|nr:iron-sulfur cluster assembly accessory protein [Thermoanaerobaculia bacterium]